MDQTDKQPLPTYTVTLPGVLAEALQDGDALTDVATERGRAGSLRVRGTADELLDLTDRMWAFEGGQGIEASAAERAAYRRWTEALRTNGIRA